MANIRVDVNFIIADGAEVVFEAPCDCSEVTGLSVYYRDALGEETFKTFSFKDTNGNDLSDLDNLFSVGAYVKVILSVTDSSAYIQNADTNAYLEGRFNALLDGTQRVGDSAKLGGKDASEYVTGVAELGTSVLEKALTLSKGVYNYHFKSTPSDLPVDSYKYGSATIFVRKENAILVVLWGINVSSTPIATNFYNGTEWSGWSKYATLADLANYLPLTGGTVGSGTVNNPLTIKGALRSILKYISADGTFLGELGFDSDGQAILYDSSNTKRYLLHTGKTVSIAQGGTGATTAKDARTNLGVPDQVVVDTKPTAGASASYSEGTYVFVRK